MLRFLLTPTWLAWAFIGGPWQVGTDSLKHCMLVHDCYLRMYFSHVSLNVDLRQKISLISFIIYWHLLMAMGSRLSRPRGLQASGLIQDTQVEEEKKEKWVHSWAHVLQMKCWWESNINFLFGISFTLKPNKKLCPALLTTPGLSQMCMLVIYLNSRLNCRRGEEGRELLPTPA